MKKLLLSTAIVAAMSAPAVAQTAEGIFRQDTSATELRASEFIGMRVYRTDAVDSEAYEGVQDNWDDIGEINDVVFSRDGSVEAVLVDIGGFLGIGENQVAVDMDSIQFVSDSATPDQETDFFLVMNATRGDLEQAPTYGAMGDQATGADEEPASASADSGEMTEETSAEAGSTATDDAANDQSTDMAAAESDTATGDNATTEEMADADATGSQPREDTGMARDGYVTASDDELVADDLTGAPAFSSDDKRIGEVSELLMAEDGKIQAAIVDVGGFLGIGEKPVQLELSKLDILRAEEGQDLRVYISMSEEELESLPEYEK